MVAALIAACVCAGCTGGGGRRWPVATASRSGSAPSGTSPAPAPPAATSPAATSPATTSPAPVPVWASRGVRPVSPVSVIGTTALVYGDTAAHLYLYGLDARTGRMLWRRSASTSGTTPGVALQVSEVHGQVAFFGPMAPHTFRARLMLVDAATGRIRARSVPMTWLDTPAACSEADPVPCAAASVPSGPPRRYRLDPRSGRLRAVAQGSRGLGDGLVDPLSRNPESIEHWAHGKYVWGQDVVNLFDPGYTTDNGWDFEKYGDMYVGTLQRIPPGTVTRRAWTIHAGRDVLTAGFDVGDGRLWWQQHGTSIGCGSSLWLGADPPTPVWCRYTGTITYHAGTAGRAPTVTTSGFSVRVQGFDPEGGRVLWSRSFGAATTLAPGAGAGGVAVSDRAVLLRVPAGPVVLDVVTGAVRSPRAGESFWCRQRREFAETPRSTPAHVGEVIASCDLQGRPAADVPPVVPLAVSTQAPGGLRLVATAGAVIAYRG